MPVYGTDPSFCLLDPVRNVLMIDGNPKIPLFITYTQNAIKIMTNDVTLTGIYVFKVAVLLNTTNPTAQFNDDSVTFQVQVHCAIKDLRPVITD